jgi:hypothetical protein
VSLTHHQKRAEAMLHGQTNGSGSVSNFDYFSLPMLFFHRTDALLHGALQLKSAFLFVEVLLLMQKNKNTVEGAIQASASQQMKGV